MGKKTKKGNVAGALPLPRPNAEKPALTPAGKRWAAAGVVLIALGMLALTQTDRYGRNAASVAAPFLILGGYAVVALGLWTSANPSEPTP